MDRKDRYAVFLRLMQGCFPILVVAMLATMLFGCVPLKVSEGNEATEGTEGNEESAARVTGTLVFASDYLEQHRVKLVFTNLDASIPAQPDYALYASSNKACTFENKTNPDVCSDLQKWTGDGELTLELEKKGNITSIIVAEDGLEVIDSTITRNYFLEEKTRGLVATASLGKKIKLWFSPRHEHTTVVHKNKLFVIGGHYRKMRDAVWSSVDGVSWVKETKENSVVFIRRAEHSSAVGILKNQIWVVGGNFDGELLNDTWSSRTGESWESESLFGDQLFPARDGHTTLIYRKKIWVIAGRGAGDRKLNDVWNSDYGRQWDVATKDVDDGYEPRKFPARVGHTSVVYNDKIWVIGGEGNDKLFNDVWRSRDGADWQDVYSEKMFSPRENHSSVVFAKKMWVIAGIDDEGRLLNDVWSSTDGEVWEKQTTDNQNDSQKFSPRMGHSSVVFAGKIWVIAGLDAQGKFLNDVWSSSDGRNWEKSIRHQWRQTASTLDLVISK